MQSSLPALVLLLIPLASAASVGFEQVSIPDSTGRPISVAIWYPSDDVANWQQVGGVSMPVALNARLRGSALPLIVISHGNGGGSFSHYDTAMALARAGFVVAAPTHTGDNYADQSYAGNRIDLTDRPRQIRVVLDYMLRLWPFRSRLNRSRLGMFGYSLGGFTTLVEAGGTPDIKRMAQLCNTRPTAPECTFVKQRHGDQLDPTTAVPVWEHDFRLRALVVAAPAVSYLFGPGSLKRVTIPIQLWRGGKDEQVPDAWNTAIIRQEIPRHPEEHVIADAGHFDFLPPCTETLARLAPQICTSAPGFDRAKFHQEFNADVVKFFENTLEN